MDEQKSQGNMKEEKPFLKTVRAWATVSATIIIALTTIAACVIYYGQKEIMGQQNVTMSNTLKLTQQQTEVLIEESVRRFRPFIIVDVPQGGRPMLTYGMKTLNTPLTVCGWRTSSCANKPFIILPSKAGRRGRPPATKNTQTSFPVTPPDSFFDNYALKAL